MSDVPLSHPVDDAWLIELLNGLLKGQQREQLLAHIRDCPECEARMRALARERELLRASPVPIVTGENVALESRKRMGRPLAVIAATAAAVVAAVIIGTMSTRDRHEQYWIPVATEERTILRTAQPTDSVDLDHALQAYEKRDARASVRELGRNFDLYDRQDSGEVVTATAIRGVFLASAQLNAGDPEEALKTLDVILVESLPPPWRERAQWVQYLALEQLGKSAAAHEMLLRLQETSGEIGQKAQKRLSEN